MTVEKNIILNQGVNDIDGGHHQSILLLLKDTPCLPLRLDSGLYPGKVNLENLVT